MPRLRTGPGRSFSGDPEAIIKAFLTCFSLDAYPSAGVDSTTVLPVRNGGMMANLLLKRLLVAGSAVTLAATLAVAQDKPAAKAAASGHPAAKEPAPNEMGHVHYLDYKNGFRGVKFGSPTSAISGLTLVTDKGSMKIYQKSDEALSLGSCQFDKIL